MRAGAGEPPGVADQSPAPVTEPLLATSWNARLQPRASGQVAALLPPQGLVRCGVRRRARRCAREEKTRLHTEQVGELLQHDQIDCGDTRVLEPAYCGAADAGARGQLGLGEAEGVTELAEAEVDRHESSYAYEYTLSTRTLAEALSSARNEERDVSRNFALDALCALPYRSAPR
jgi:hypothetical protein